MKSQITSFWGRSSRTTRWLLILAAVLIVIRIALPYAVESYVNHTLNKSRDYSGRIGHVNLKLWRGGYRINQIRISKREGQVQSPLFSAQELDLTIDWRELFHGSLVGEVMMQQPRVNFVEGPTAAQTQSGKNEDWDKMLESLFPFKLNRFEISNGEIHFQNPSSKPPVDIYTTGVFATATNLTNARDLKEKLPSGLSAHGSIYGNGKLNLDLHMNLVQAKPAFEVNFGVTNVNLVDLNDFLRAYGKFDVQRGDFALFTSIASGDGAYEGYFKVFFANLNIFEWEKERKKNVLEIFWQAVVGSVATIFKNQSKDQLAAKVPISGTYSNSSVGVLTAVGTLLQNAFIHALVPKLDKPVTVDQIEKTTEKK